MSFESTEGSKVGKQALAEKWRDSEAQERMQEQLEQAKTMSSISSALNDNTIGGFVIGEAQGEIQIAPMERLQPILDDWLHLEGSGDDAALNLYDGARTLLEEFPGDAVRRKLDQMLRHQLGIEKVDGWL